MEDSYSILYGRPSSCGLNVSDSYYNAVKFSPLEYKDVNISFNLNDTPIPKLEDTNIHYRCPICFNFPLIEFIDKNEDIINHTCACHIKKPIKISDLFIKEKNHMSFSDNDISSLNNINDSNWKKILGFKCLEHISQDNKNSNFEYYCLFCYENICKDCLEKHLNKKHDLIPFVYRNVEAKKKMSSILKFEKDEEIVKDIEFDNENSINLNKSEFEKILEADKNDKKINDNTRVLVLTNNSAKSIPNKEKEKIHSNFITLINIIINDYLKFPNYLHFINIENIYRVLIRENSSEKKEKPKNNNNLYIKLIYIIDKNPFDFKLPISYKFKDIHRFNLSKINPRNKKFNYFYNGYELEEEKTIGEIITERDKERNRMEIIAKEVTEIDKIKIKEITCPICFENIFIDFDKYKINLKGCINGHHQNKILFEDFMKTQKTEISDSYYYCGICNRKVSYQMRFYSCFSCKKNLCLSCKEKHDITHQIVDYRDKNYVCNIHNGIFHKYCIQCKKNLCFDCEKDHINHNYINFKDIIPDKDNILKEIEVFKQNIENLKNNVKMMIIDLNTTINNIEIYYKISAEIAKSFYNMKYKDYQIIYNINEFKKYNKIINEDIKKIINNNDTYTKFKYLTDIFKHMSKNCIYGVIDIDKFSIDKSIRIINSYEQRKKEGELKNSKFDSLYENEEELKKNCDIKIDNIPIGFSYFYNFDTQGSHIIQYSFENNITKSNDLFAHCKMIKSLDFRHFSTEKITNMCSMFFECRGLEDVDLSNFKTENVINMSYMFAECESLKRLDVSCFNTKKVNDMNSFLAGCKSLTHIDLSKFDINNVKDLSWMFFGCNALNYINLSSFNTKDVLYMNTMLNGLNLKSQVIIITQDKNIIDKIKKK